MGFWVNTTYVNDGDVQRVAAALTDLVRSEGMHPVEAPAPHAYPAPAANPMQYRGAHDNDLWGAALFPGAPGWTVIQTAPFELPGERAHGAPAMRLCGLCRALGAAGVQIHVYDSSGSVLVEVTAGGRVHLSGFWPPARRGSPFLWNDERLAEATWQSGFRLLPLADVFDLDLPDEEKAAALAARLGGDNVRYCDNSVSVGTLICHGPFEAPGGTARYFARQHAPERRNSTR